MVRNAACLLAAAVVVSVFAAACGGGGGTKTVVRTIEPGQASPPPVVTGDGEVDKVIDAALKVDDIALAGLTGYQMVPCKKAAPEELAGAPACRDNEADATPVEVLASSSCENGWVRPEQVPDAFRLALSPDKPELALVVKPSVTPATYGGGFKAGQAVVIHSKSASDGSPAGVSLHVYNGRVVWIENSCRNLAELTTPDKVEAVIFDPKNPAASASPTPPAAAAPTAVP